MPYTEHCDLYSEVHEEGINRILRHLMRQRPSLFNYGTSYFQANPDKLLSPPNPTSDVLTHGNPLVAPLEVIEVPGTNGEFVFHYFFQIAAITFDFHPGNVLTLPAELNPPLGAQRVAIRIRVCGGLARPVSNARFIAPPPRPSRQTTREARESERIPIRVGALPVESVESFALDLFATAHMAITPHGTAGRLGIALDSLEIVDIQPSGLENSLEYLIEATLTLGILPNLRLALDTLVFKLGEFGTLALVPTPISGPVAHNPAIEDDRVKVYLNVEIHS